MSQGDYRCLVDVGITPRSASKYDHLTLLRRGGDGGAHAFEALRVAPSEGIVDHYRGATVVDTDDRRARKPAKNAELFARAGTELIRIKGDSVECTARNSKVIVEFHSESRAENYATKLVDALLERLHVTLA